MGDSTDGSSMAARSAQSLDNSKTPGFFRRILAALGPEAPGERTSPVGDQHVTSLESRTPDLQSLGRVRVNDVAIPKADIVAVSVDATKSELVEAFRETGFSRLPVYDGTLDTPLGMVHLKDFALSYGFNGGSDKAVDLRGLLRPLLFVPPSMSIGVLLTRMQAERRHMALVIDEYGGVDGLVTIEDLIEEVVGEIEDEHDTDEDRLWVAETPGQYLALAKTPLDEFEAETGLRLTEAEEVDEEEIDTLGGLVFMLAGRVPVRGEVVQHPSGLEFEVVDADPRRIKRLRLRLKSGAS